MTTLTLPETLDRKTVTELSRKLLAHRGTAIAIDAGSVRKLGTIGFEMLIAVRHQWQSDGMTIEFRNWTEDAIQTLNRIGASPEMLSDGAGQ